MNTNKKQDRGFGPTNVSVPKTFDQLGILVLDGSGSMEFGLSASKRKLSEEVSSAVKDTFSRFKSSAQKNNFSFAVVNYDDEADIRLGITPAKSLNDQDSYIPTEGRGGATSIAAGLKKAKEIADDFLSTQSSGGISKSVIIVILSDGMDMTENETLSIANTLKANSQITITACFFETLGGDVNMMNEAKEFLKKICSAPNGFAEVVDAEKVRIFFVASVSSNKVVV